MWSIVKWKEFNIKRDNWDLFYSAVPASWVKFENEKLVLFWPLYSSVQKDRKEGNPIKGSADQFPCTVLASGYLKFEDAQKGEKIWHDKEKNNFNLTTDYSDTENVETVPTKMQNIPGCTKNIVNFNEQASLLLLKSTSTIPEASNSSDSVLNPQMFEPHKSIVNLNDLDLSSEFQKITVTPECSPGHGSNYGHVLPVNSMESCNACEHFMIFCDKSYRFFLLRSFNSRRNKKHFRSPSCPKCEDCRPSIHDRGANGVFKTFNS